MKRYSYVLGELKKYDIDQQYLSEQLGRGRTYVSQRFNGKGAFTLDEAYQIMRMCNLPYSEIYKAFPPGGIAVHEHPKRKLFVLNDARRKEMY